MNHKLCHNLQYITQEDDYLQFLESLKEGDTKEKCFREKYKNRSDRRVGVKDWYKLNKFSMFNISVSTKIFLFYFYVWVNGAGGLRANMHIWTSRLRTSDFHLLQYWFNFKYVSLLKFISQASRIRSNAKTLFHDVKYNSYHSLFMYIYYCV